MSTPATIQLLWNHSRSDPVLQLYSVIVRCAEPNPSRPTQPHPPGPRLRGGWRWRAEVRVEWKPDFPVEACVLSCWPTLAPVTAKSNHLKLLITTGVLVSLLRLLQSIHNRGANTEDKLNLMNTPAVETCALWQIQCVSLCVLSACLYVSIWWIIFPENVFPCEKTNDWGKQDYKCRITESLDILMGNYSVLL